VSFKHLIVLSAEEPLVKVPKLSRTISSEALRTIQTVSIAADEPVVVRQRSPSPARRPPSNVVHVTGLVRPFTLGQLKQLLGRTGKLVDDGFWIDSIKSHCYVVVCTTPCVLCVLVSDLETRKPCYHKETMRFRCKFRSIQRVQEVVCFI